MTHNNEKDAGCCTSCEGLGGGMYGPCWCCRGTGCAHPDPCPTQPAEEQPR